MTEIIEEINRKIIVAELILRDGYVCQYPGCDLPFDERENSRHSVTIDHIFPQAKARALGHTFQQIWSLDNLQLMGRTCNSKKSDHLYDENGMLPVRDHVRVIKSARPVQCETCSSGRLLLHGEICVDCGSGPQPATAPKYLQKPVKECDHDTSYCWMCYLDMIPRRSALSSLLHGPEGAVLEE